MLAMMIAITSFAQGEKTLKRKVAIGRFTNETQYAKGIFYERENDPIAKQALDILSSKLASSGKFILLERDGLEELVAEAGSEMQKIGADYIILGSVTKFGRKVEGDHGVFTETKTQTVEAGVSIRLVEVSTGLIIYSDEASGFAETTAKQTLGLGGTSGFDATLSDKAISAAMTQLVENIINKCMDKPWKGYLLSIEDDTYIMDTPGFSSLYTNDFEKEELKFYFTEFSPYEGQCRFLGCDHVHEPGCAVKEALQEGKIHPVRYENYLEMYTELKERRRY